MSKRDLKSRASDGSRTLAAPNYVDQCNSHDLAVMVGNGEYSDAASISFALLTCVLTANPVRDMQHWLINFTPLSDLQRANWQCDHVLELWQVQAFFNIPDQNGVWADGNARWQRIWQEINNGYPDGVRI